MDRTMQHMEPETWKFSDILSNPSTKKRWEKVRRYFFLRESTYDMTSRCNIRCNGCYYFEGDKQYKKDITDIAAWQELMKAEKARGITFAVLAGAEPSLVPELIKVCQEQIPLGAVATNGLKFIPMDINYKIHISVWGDDAQSLATRNAKKMLARQMEKYQGDKRAVFVYTFTRYNIHEARSVTKTLVESGHKVTFNMFSAPVGYRGDLCHDKASLLKTREVMVELINAYPENVLFSSYSAVAHTHEKGLHDLYKCAYPRQNPSKNLGLGRSFRQYRTDLTWDRGAACCVPDTDCPDCRHYAAGSAVVTSRMFRHAETPETFRAWLDYVDTYLSVWVAGYEKGENLTKNLTPPPGFSL